MNLCIVKKNRKVYKPGEAAYSTVVRQTEKILKNNLL